MGRCVAGGVLSAGCVERRSFQETRQVGARDALGLSEHQSGYEPESTKGGSGQNALHNYQARRELDTAPSKGFEERSKSGYVDCR